ncbi:MAG TPA: Hpt domain-containing protein, partial [Gammaproteobacteria bacterium]|nr:Hpt domain-containing protein [Gammaproteobacteria bacterium]
MTPPANERLIEEFVVEAREHLSAIEPDLLSLEAQDASCDADTIHRIFRALHSIKGGAGLLGLERINRLSHAMEALIMRCRDGELTPDPMMIDTLLAGMDGLQAMLADIWNSNEFPCADLIDILQSFLDAETAPGQAEALEALPHFSPFTVDEIEEAASRAADQTLCWVHLELSGSQDGQPVAPAAILAEMESIGEIMAGRLQVNGMHGLADCLQGKAELHLLYATMMEREHVAPILEIPAQWVSAPVAAPAASSEPNPEPDPVPAADPDPVFPQERPPEPAPAPSPAAREQPPPPANTQGAADTVRVRVDLLNTMMNLAGELVLSRNQLLHALE